MEYPTQIRVDDEMVMFQRDWTTEERKRFERIFLALCASGKLPDHSVIEAHTLAFFHMIALDNFYKQTQTADHE